VFLSIICYLSKLVETSGGEELLTIREACMVGSWRSKFGAFALGSALVLLGSAVGHATAYAQAPAAARDPAPAAGALANPLATFSLDRLSATRERPLFSPSRRPPVAPPAPVAAALPPPPPPQLTLFGIVMDAEDARAIVKMEPANEIRRVRIGDDIGGWKVAQIQQRHLVLSLDSRIATFTLFDGHAKSAAATVPSPNPPAPTPAAAMRKNLTLEDLRTLLPPIR
jgi:hypothetical protein